MTEVWPPAVVNTASATGTGQIPDKEDQMYVVTRDDLYLVPTAEVPVTNLHRDEILEATELPIRYAAYTPCFRREAGAAGKDTRGILRVHQFDKVEMVLFEKPDDSAAALEWMTERAEILLQRLGLAYRVLLMSTREMGFTQARKYDLEVWSPGVERWLEVSSCSNFRDFQARRMAIRYRPEPGAKPELVHTLNGSGPRARPCRRRACSRPTSSRTARSSCPRCFGATWGALPSPEREDASMTDTPPQPDAPVAWESPERIEGPAPGIEYAPHGGRLVAYILDGLILTRRLLDHRASRRRHPAGGGRDGRGQDRHRASSRRSRDLLPPAPRPLMIGVAATSRTSGRTADRRPGCGRSACASCVTATAAGSAGGPRLPAPARPVGRGRRLLPRLHLDLRRQAPARLAGPHRRDHRHQAALTGSTQRERRA